MNLQKYSITFVPPAVGLVNTSQMCWLNSLLQFLLSMPALNKIITECASAFKQNVFARSYITAISSVMAGESINSADLLKAMIQRGVKKSVKIAFSNGQECVHEAFVKFIELIGNEHIDNVFLTRYNVSYTPCHNCDWVYQTAPITTGFIMMYENYKMTTALEFRNWILKHSADHEWQCPECAVQNAATVTETLGKLSEIIVIVFNQFAGKHSYYFPPALTFNGVSGPMNYKLIGRVEHSGSAHGGHYRATVVRSAAGDPKWVTINDSAISPLETMPEVNPSVFMIAYHLV